MTKEFHSAPTKEQKFITWLNESGEEVPSYGIVEVQSYSSTDKEMTIVKPTGSGSLFFCNGPVSVADGDRGESMGWEVGPQVVLIDVPTETVGTTVGPVANSWAAGQGGTGFQLVTNVEDKNGFDVGSIIRQGGGPASEGTGGGGGCQCACITQSDLTIGQMRTTTTWTVDMSGAVTVKVANGSITLRSGSYLIVWDENQSMWIGDVLSTLTEEGKIGGPGGSLVALNAEDSDVSETATFHTVEFKMALDVSGWTELTLTIDGTIPAS